jgi:hypothetical protein
LPRAVARPMLSRVAKDSLSPLVRPSVAGGDGPACDAGLAILKAGAGMGTS